MKKRTEDILLAIALIGAVIVTGFTVWAIQTGFYERGF